MKMRVREVQAAYERAVGICEQLGTLSTSEAAPLEALASLAGCPPTRTAIWDRVPNCIKLYQIVKSWNISIEIGLPKR